MKIVCSIGPNAKKLNAIADYASEGMNIARFNFSHANYDAIKTQIDYIKEKYPNIEVLQDLQGNKIRVSNIFQREIKVSIGNIVYFCSEKFFNDKNKLNGILVPLSLETDFKSLYSAEKILMKDATIEFAILGRGKNKEVIKTIVKRGGLIRGEKGVNAPGMNRSNMGLTEKDKIDIKWGLENKVDIICLSYVTKAEDILSLKAYINKLKKNNSSFKTPKIWAKIECSEGVDNFREILSKVDGIMLGRGDLYAEVDYLEIPKVQEQLLKIMKKSKKDFIIATHLLESMKRGVVPTLPEINDIYTYIKEGVTGFMLCGELTVGKNPIETIKVLKLLIDKYEINKEGNGE